jgi:hypothetical protein
MKRRRRHGAAWPAIFVIAGLDPAIHPPKAESLNEVMDARVKPGHDKVI